jgi:inositol-phosphate phosphatase/L-galactose 1-phosphate phosphatase
MLCCFEDGFGGPWDVAAGQVIIEEAGGECRLVSGAPFQLMAGKGNVICGAGRVVEDIARVLAEVPAQPASG